MIPIVFGAIDEPTPASIAGLDRTTSPVSVPLSGDAAPDPRDPRPPQTRPLDKAIGRLTHAHGLVRRRDIRTGAVGVLIAILAAFSSFTTASWVRTLYDKNQAENARVAESAARIAERDQKEKAELRAKVAVVQQLSIRSQVAAQEGDRSQALLLAATAVRQADPRGGSGRHSSPRPRRRVRNALRPMTGPAPCRGDSAASRPTTGISSPSSRPSPAGEANAGKTTFLDWPTATLSHPRRWEVDGRAGAVFVSNARVAGPAAERARPGSGRSTTRAPRSRSRDAAKSSPCPTRPSSSPPSAPMSIREGDGSSNFRIMLQRFAGRTGRYAVTPEIQGGTTPGPSGVARGAADLGPRRAGEAALRRGAGHRHVARRRLPGGGRDRARRRSRQALARDR